ncbi:hypothetical protein N9R82_02280 [Flavobacteriaceae bacterium]|nr:hypothetical protein [Flavobacteriaceae bacterium]
MKLGYYFLYILSFVLIISCSAEDDGGTSTPPPTTQQPTPTPTPQVPAPGKSGLSAPENNEVCYEGEAVDESNSEVTFSWDASSDTDSYDLQITNQETNQTQTESGITATSKAVTLATDVSYSWKVVSKANDTNDTTSSDTWQFYLAGDGQENYAPFPATILSPTSGAAVDASNGLVTLSWEGNDPDEGDSLTYTIYFDEVDGLQDPQTANTNITDTSLEVEVESGTTYYWRVKTSDGTSSSFTLVYSFIVN